MDGPLTQYSAVDHVVHTAGRAHDDLDAHLQAPHVLPQVGAANAGVAADVHVVAKRQHHFLDLRREARHSRDSQTHR